jgi:hypothetical protein
MNARVTVWGPPDLAIRYLEHERRIVLSRKGNTMKKLVHVIQLAICVASLLTTPLFAQSSGGGSSSSGGSGSGSSGSGSSGTGTGTSGTSGSSTSTSGSTASGSTGTSKKDEDGSATEPQTRGMKEGSK